MDIQRRHLLVAGSGLALGMGAHAQPEQFADLYAKAKAEGELTWYTSHFGTDIAEAIGRRFSEVYPGVKVNVVRASAQVIYQRLGQDMRSKVRKCDVFGTSDQTQNTGLRAANMLAAYKPRALPELAAPVRAASDPDGYFTPTDCSMQMLICNSKLVPDAQAPKKWSDLADPRWAGQVSLAHPGFSGAMGAWVVSMDKMYGWSFFEQLAKNKAQVARSLTEPPTTVGTGERKIGIGSSNLIAGMQARGMPLKGILPEEGVQFAFNTSAIMANAPHPNAARLFLEFLLSRNSVMVRSAHGGMSIRNDVKTEPAHWAPGAVKGFRATPEEIEAKLPALVEKWRDTFGV